MIFEFVVHAN